MPKVVGPGFSLDATKSIGKKLTFQKRPSGPSVYFYKKPGSRAPFVPTASQVSQRIKVGGLVATWQAFSASVKAQWDDDAKRAGFVGTGYHLFLHKNAGYILPEVHVGEWADPLVSWADSVYSWTG